MKKIQYNGSSKILIGIVTKINLIIDKLVVDVKVNGTSVVVVNEDGEREADIDLSLADQNVKQSPTTSSDNSDYRLLLSKSANDTEETDISRKDTNLKYNPSTGNLQTTKLNGNTVPSGSGNDTLAKTSDIPDLSNYVQKSLTVGLIKNDGTIDQTQYATMSDIPDELADLADDSTHRLVTDTQITSWNNKSDSDENVKQTDITDTSWRCLAMASDSTKTETTAGVRKTVGLSMQVNKVGTASQAGAIVLAIGNNIASGNDDNYKGYLDIYNNGKRSRIYSNTTDNRNMIIPNKAGTFALTDDLPTNPVLWSEYNVLGSKNLLNISGAERNNLGVNSTLNQDGSVTVNGTATGQGQMFVYNYCEFPKLNLGDKIIFSFEVLSGSYTHGSSSSLTRIYLVGLDNNTLQNNVCEMGASLSVGDKVFVTYEIDSHCFENGICKINGVQGYFRSGDVFSNLKLGIMVRLESVADDTFEPYAQTNRQLTLAKQSWEDNMASGVKNYFPYPFEIHPKQGEVYTQRAIRWTDGGNGIIVANGTNDNTGNSYCQLLPTSETASGTNIRFCTLPAGKYHFSGGISEDYYLNLSTGLKTATSDRTTLGEDTGNGFDFDVTEAMAQNNMFCSFAFVKKGKSATNVQFKPMITRYEDSSVGFAEYAMTNKELTQFKTDMLTIATTETSGTASRAYDVGDYIFWRRGLYRVTQAISSGGAITLNTNVVATDLGSEVKKSKMWSNENIATIPNSSSSSKVYVTTSAYATEIYVQRMNIRSTSLGINETGYCSVTIPILPSMTNNYFVFMFRGDIDNKLYDGRLLFQKDSNGVYGYVSKVYQDGVLKSANDLEADIVVFEKS